MRYLRIDLGKILETSILQSYQARVIAASSIPDLSIAALAIVLLLSVVGTLGRLFLIDVMLVIVF
jgi:hypothetical protein